MDIVFATNNYNKVREVKEIFAEFNLDFNVLTPKEIGLTGDIYEDGNSFEENSFLKANFYYEKFGLPTIADDSGICVDALNGEPGIMSARYSGGDEEDNIDLLLKNMEGVQNRKAHFHCDLCVIINNEVYHFIGDLDGYIRKDRCGDNGFGYDPIFDVYYDGIKLSLASLSEQEKNKISHRYQAVYNFAKFVKDRNMLK